MDLLGSSAIVETAIGLALVFFLAAGVCTAVVEAVASLGSFRAKVLWRTVARWFDDDLQPDTRWGATRALALLRSDVGVTPTQDADRDPVTAFICGLPGVSPDPHALRKVKAVNRDAAVASLAALAASPPGSFADTELGRALGRLDAALGTAETTAAERVTWIERWYDAEMARLTVTYRARSRWFAGVVSLVLVLGVGLDAINLTSELYQDPTRRQVLAVAAGREVADGADPCADEAATTTTTTTAPATTATTGPEPTAVVQDRLACAQRLADSVGGLQVGRWTPTGDEHDLPSSAGGWVVAVLGMAITVGALTVGSPWWFAILNGLMRMRSGPRANP